MKRVLILAVSFAACAACAGTDRADQYGFVATLGRDTVALERVARRGDSVITDAVDRFPLVRRRHTVVTIGPDGAMRHLAMDVRTPSAPPAQRLRHIVADIGADSLRVTLTDSAGSVHLSYGTGGVLTMPHVPQSYSLLELYIAAAVARGSAMHLAPGDSVALHQFYPDRDTTTFVIHDGWVLPKPGNAVEIWHDWLSGIGAATLDTNRRLLTYSGARSTYKVEVKRLAQLPDVESVGDRFAAAEQASGARELSVRDTVRATIGTDTFAIDYGRPLARGRALLGDVISLGSVWRTGANAATQFSASRPIMIGKLRVPAGKYTLWTEPRADGVGLIVNKQTGQWGTEYDGAQDLGTTPLTTETLATSTERFTISVTSTDAAHGALVLAWGTFRWTAPIVVTAGR